MRSAKGCRPVLRWLRGGLAAAAIVFPTSLHADYRMKAGDVSFNFYGFIQADFIYDFQRVDPDWKDLLRPSKIPVNCPEDPGCGRDGETIFSVRQTRAGFDALVPTGLGDLKTKLEFELVGVGNDAGKTTPFSGFPGFFRLNVRAETIAMYIGIRISSASRARASASREGP